MKKSKSKQEDQIDKIKHSIKKNFFLWINEIILFIRIFSPYVILLICFTAFLTVFSQNEEGDTKFLLEVGIIVLSGYVGSLLTSRWEEIRGDSYLIKKSNSAIRNLQLIKNKINNIRFRIDELRNSKNERDSDEVGNLVNNIHKDILNSIRDWGDVNPGANVLVDVYEAISSREKTKNNLEKEVKVLNTKINNLEEQNAQEKTDLQSELEKKNNEINDLNSQIFNLNNSSIYDLSTSSTVSSASLSTVPYVSSWSDAATEISGSALINPFSKEKKK